MSTDQRQLMIQTQELQRTLEVVDNKARINNLRLKGLKEGIEESDLKAYLETLLTCCLPSETGGWVIGLSFANRVGIQDKGQNKNRDRDVILGFQHGEMKRLVLEHLWDGPKIIVEGQQLTFYSDVSPITLRENGLFSL